MARADTDADGDDTGIDPDAGPATDADRVLDVRETDAPPFERITSALTGIEGEETLVIVNSFEPEPLYGELERRGFTHRTTRIGPEEWRVAVEHE